MAARCGVRDVPAGWNRAWPVASLLRPENAARWPLAQCRCPLSRRECVCESERSRGKALESSRLERASVGVGVAKKKRMGMCDAHMAHGCIMHHLGAPGGGAGCRGGRGRHGAWAARKQGRRSDQGPSERPHTDSRSVCTCVPPPLVLAWVGAPRAPARAQRSARGPAGAALSLLRDSGPAPLAAPPHMPR